MGKIKIGLAIVVVAMILVAGGAFLLGVTAAKPPVPVMPDNDQGADPAPTPNTTAPPPGPIESNPFGLGAKEAQFYAVYLERFVAPTGAAISNVVPLSWCPNKCIGCDGDVSSEAVGRSGSYSAMTKDKPVFDRYTAYYYARMRHPGTDHMQWKLNNDGTVGSCGGQNSAVDGELEMIEGLGVARRQWTADAQLKPYLDTEKLIISSLQDGIVTTPYGQTLPHCLYPTSNDPATAKSLPCGDTGGKPLVYLGYLNLVALKEMKTVDSATWTPVYDGAKRISIAAIQDGGVMTSYELASNTFGRRESYIHNLWVIKHLLEDGSAESTAAAKPLYDKARAQFYTNGQICDDFVPGTGCKPGTRTGAYAEYLEMAVALKDTTFVNDLIKTLHARCAIDELGEGKILCGPDNFGNIVVMQAFANARLAGYTVG